MTIGKKAEPFRKVVVESPLKGDFERNRRYALWCCYHCRTLGEAAYASHLFYTQFLDDEDLVEREFGITAGLEWAACADMRIFYMDLGWSNGMKRALEVAGPEYEARKLPSRMLEAFERGEYPKTTRGFEKG